MSHTLKRRLAGGALAIAMASGIALTGAGAASAFTPPPPPSPAGSYVGQVGYTQAGSDPHLHKFTWTGDTWRYDGCYGGPFTEVR